MKDNNSRGLKCEKQDRRWVEKNLKTVFISLIVEPLWCINEREFSEMTKQRGAEKIKQTVNDGVVFPEPVQKNERCVERTSLF